MKSYQHEQTEKALEFNIVLKINLRDSSYMVIARLLHLRCWYRHTYWFCVLWNMLVIDSMVMLGRKLVNIYWYNE